MQKYAGIILVARNGDLIFQQRDNRPDIVNAGKITTFGGVVEFSEESIDAAIREIKEELNLDIKKDKLKLLGTYQKTEEVHGDNCFCYIYIAKDINPKKLKLSEGESIFIFKKNDDASRYNFSVLARQLIKDYNRGR